MLQSIEIKKLFAFCTVAETLSFTEAAKTLNIGQSTISHHISTLEKELNVELIKRTSRSVELTFEGQKIYFYAKKIFDAFKIFESYIHHKDPAVSLDTVSPLMQSYKITAKAAEEGFDWESPFQAADKVKEEIEEVISELHKSDSADRQKAIEEEIGDLFMACCELSRHCRVIPDEAILKGVSKFTTRYSHFKDYIQKKGVNLSELDSTQINNLWRESRK